MTISYTRTISFPPWLDNRDRVKAAGDDGFNVRFQGIEAELDTISGVVSEVNDELTTQSGQISSLQQQVSALGGVVAAPVTLGLAPLMLPYNPDAASSAWSPMYWSTAALGQPDGSYVKVPAVNLAQPNPTADGVLPLTLPEGVKLLTLAVLGEAANAQNMSTVLVAELRASPFTATPPLATLQGFVSSTISGSPVFNSDTYLYYIRATMTNATAADRLRGFVIKYQPSS